jgi:nucleoside-diphosphate-sugar epimerase
MRVLVAGGSGVLGSAVVSRLVRDGHRVFATTRRQERMAAIRAQGAEPVVMDALDPSSTRHAVDASAPDAIVHQLTDLAGADFAANARLRVEGTANLVAAAQAHGIDRMVAQSISWAYEPGSSPADERVPLARDPRDGSPGFAAIEALESAVLRLAHGVVLRYGLLYGPGTWYASDGDMWARAARGEVAATTAWTSFVHVDDAADAAVAALSWPRGIVNVVDDEPTHVDEWGPLLVSAAGATVSSISARAEGRAARNDKARALGWVPRHPSWREMLRPVE